jgi:hypothetical protein
MLEPGGDGSSAPKGRGPSSATRRLVGKSPEGSRQPVERLDLHFAYLRRPGSGAIGPATCGIYERSVPAHARCCPSFARVRTQHGLILQP